MTQPTQAPAQQAPSVLLSVELINAIIGYLDTRPHGEVRRFIDGIHSQVMPQVNQQVQGGQPPLEQLPAGNPPPAA